MSTSVATYSYIQKVNIWNIKRAALRRSFSPQVTVQSFLLHVGSGGRVVRRGRGLVFPLGFPFSCSNHCAECRERVVQCAAVTLHSFGLSGFSDFFREVPGSLEVFELFFIQNPRNVFLKNFFSIQSGVRTSARTASLKRCRNLTGAKQILSGSIDCLIIFAHSKAYTIICLNILLTECSVDNFWRRAR
jgi:hypothetical protein